MIKNNSIELGTYVSPAIKVAQIKARRVMCQSPGYNSEGLKDFQSDIQDEKEDWGY